MNEDIEKQNKQIAQSQVDRFKKNNKCDWCGADKEAGISPYCDKCGHRKGWGFLR